MMPDYKSWRQSVEAYLKRTYGYSLADSGLSEERIGDEYDLDKLEGRTDFRHFAEQIRKRIEDNDKKLNR